MVVTNLEEGGVTLNDTGLDFIPKGNNAEEIAEWLMKNYNAAKKLINNNKTVFISEYSNLSFARFVISNTHFNSWKDALGAAGFKAFRDNNKSRIYETASFGFPVIHRTTPTTVTGKAGGEPYARRSSPIIFKVIKAGNKFYWIVIRLSGEFLPDGGVIKANNTQKTQKPDYGIIDEYWSELKSNGTEYILSMPDSLKDIIGKIRKEYDPQKIILFGSKARGDFHSRSDTDIAVESEKQLPTSTLNGALDMINLKTAEVSLKKIIDKEGVVIYERKN